MRIYHPKRRSRSPFSSSRRSRRTRERRQRSATPQRHRREKRYNDSPGHRRGNWRSRSHSRSLSPHVENSREKSNSPPDWRKQRELDQRKQFRPYETDYQTSKYWERRRAVRDRAGAEPNIIVWARTPPQPYQEEVLPEGPTINLATLNGEQTSEELQTSDNLVGKTPPLNGNSSPPSLSSSPSSPSSCSSDSSYRSSSSRTSSQDRGKNTSKKSKKYESHKHTRKSGKNKKTKRHSKHKKHDRHCSSSSSNGSSTSDSDDSEQSSTEEDTDDEQKQFIRQMKQKKRELERLRAEQQDTNECIGPVLPSADNSASRLPLDYGKALLPGEGAAMAAYIAEGKRIPRRGEIGLTCDEIEKYEAAGFVMSGSRHRRMEAVRLRKENQIYSADEKRALEHFNHAERAKREAKLQAQFKALIKRKLEDKQSVH
ncbi:unnamed protein product [Protopolystoma xenopodis]|uniref:NF-kappa-B-activating protein C-terminal domain-containing protein n=1 Tax=Protopolystoma xenopodis TaxID=117903 RepID=A0A3S4ZUZ8_9PLAT|nr:unnamed protein product [Protopolystoma xenopodis]